MTRASVDWPRTYLLQIHADAVLHGLVFIEPISKDDATSLRQRLYRVRRRSDKSTAAFIPPEYHMVTIGAWQDVNGGRLPIIYNKHPDGKALPSIRPATADEITALFPSAPLAAAPALTPDQFLANITEADLTLQPEEVDSFVADLVKQAKRRGGGDDADE